MCHEVGQSGEMFSVMEEDFEFNDREKAEAQRLVLLVLENHEGEVHSAEA